MLTDRLRLQVAGQVRRGSGTVDVAVLAGSLQVSELALDGKVVAQEVEVLEVVPYPYPAPPLVTGGSPATGSVEPGEPCLATTDSRTTAHRAQHTAARHQPTPTTADGL